MKLDMCRCFHLLPDHYPIFTFLWINDPVIMLDFMNMHNNYSDKTIELKWYLGDGQNYDSSEPSNRATFSVLVSTDEETIYTRRD